MGDSSTTMDVKPPHVAFQSKELENLLDVIDRLRAQGISRFIDLPQMIVCGDQSSGKSSVLEAVSGVRFPTKDNLCTRFPTELILRRSPETSTSISIVPDANRPDAEKAELESFEAGSEALDDFGSIVESAARAMGLNQNSKVFSNDVLRVELTGPKLPHLTLVDLPGLFHSGNKNQSTEDAEAVKALVTKYMQKARSIILAVVSAKNDYANQIVTKFARDVDPSGERTLGIITKPDTLHAGSESEKQFLELAENKDVVLRLGWHILKNRDFDTKDCTADERDEAETKFFSTGIWTSLSPTQIGIGSLKPRLSRILREQILTELPGLTQDVQDGIKECESRLHKLGVSRATIKEQRSYLHHISQELSKIIHDAVEGHYNHPYFDESSSAGYPKRIRAVVVNLLDEFSKAMNERGKKYVIVDKESRRWEQPDEIVPTEEFSGDESSVEELSGEESSDEISDDEKSFKVNPSIKVSREQRLTAISKLLKENRGRELPGFAKFETVTTLFREQCQPWKNLVKSFCDDIFDAVQNAIYLALSYTTDRTTRDGILRSIVNPSLDQIRADLNARVAENLQQHEQGHPITFNHYFTDNIQKLRNEHHAKYLGPKLQQYFGLRTTCKRTTLEEFTLDIADLVSILTNRTEADMNKFACSEALHYMEAYYKVALKFFIDDFSIHTIEQGLLEQLETIFDPAKIFMYDDDGIQDIAGESVESVAERTSSSTKLAALKDAHKLLRQLDRGLPKVRSS